MARNVWLQCADSIASSAICIFPSVPFLNPTGIESPETSFLCSWDSVVLAPIAHQLTRSAIYCGVRVSSHSTAVGSPSLLMSSNNFLALWSHSFISQLSSKCGSFMSPFHPTVVRGFSKYVRITRNTFLFFSCNSLSKCAYSIASSTLWIEQGPLTTKSLGSRILIISETIWRASSMCWAVCLSRGSLSIRCCGVVIGAISSIRLSSVREKVSLAGWFIKNIKK